MQEINLKCVIASPHIPQELLIYILTTRVHGNTARGDPDTNLQELQKRGTR